MPLQNIQEKIDNYLLNEEKALFIYDARLGWQPRPNGQSHDKLLRYNSAGLRAPVEYTLQPDPAVFRIALFGDSFTHDDEVPYENSWGYYLQEQLSNADQPVEILNFAVSGYGMDQAYIRWQEMGHDYQPDLVIFGLQMENVNRNVNLIRPLYLPLTNLSFSKPRFIQQANDLHLINVPAVPPAQLPETMTNIGAWEWAPYEYFLDYEKHQPHFWLHSKLIAFVMAVFAPADIEVNVHQQEIFASTAEPAQITQALLQSFSREVEATGATFVMVHLPMVGDLQTLSQRDELPYQKRLMTVLEAEQTIIDPAPRMLLETDNLGALFKQLHYSAQGNEIIGQTVAQFILENELMPPSKQ